jgi:acetoin utilization protein AcuC
VAGPSDPLLVYGPRSLEYDFGPAHPLSPRRFGPGMDLLRTLGAEPGLAPEPASDEELEWLHSPAYVAAVRAFSIDPHRSSEAGIGPGDDPAFAGMHEAAAAVAGGSIRAVEAILSGEVDHAYHPGGGLHHARRSRASGFCVYNDVALAIARARRDGLRVLYVDLDVHHGDGVQALHYTDPGVVTVSFHESGRSLFPGTGFVDELGEGAAAGTSVNVPLEPRSGPAAWLSAVRAIVPPLAAAFGPGIVVSQHGADGHAWDPLAHLALTTTVMGEAARLVDRIAHRHASGRWLATGGGGYSVYRVVPRAWALTWLAAAHRVTPDRISEAWRERWKEEAARWAEMPLPSTFDDGAGGDGIPAAGSPGPSVSSRDAATVELVRTLTVPAFLRVAEARGWWLPDGDVGAAGVTRAVGATTAGASGHGRADPAETTSIVALTPELLERLDLASRALPPADPSAGMTILRTAVRDGSVATGAVTGEWLVGAALAVPGPASRPDQLAALGVAPEWRRRGLAAALLRALVAEQDRRGRGLAALNTAAERDPFEPLPGERRRQVAARLFRAAGMTPDSTPGPIGEADGTAEAAILRPRR